MANYWTEGVNDALRKRYVAWVFATNFCRAYGKAEETEDSKDILDQ